MPGSILKPARTHTFLFTSTKNKTPSPGGASGAERFYIMKSIYKITTVQGIEFRVWSDFIARGTFAENLETGEVKAISSSGYLSADLSIRKAIAIRFGLPSFRK